jgi:phosphoglycerate dehydrogenase-like enzyme
MRIVVCLPNAVDVFRASAEQVAELARRLPEHEVIHAETEPDLLELLPSADGVVVWRFEAGWYARAPHLAHVGTPAAGREAIAPDPLGRAVLHFGRFHGNIMAESLLAMLLFMHRRLGTALAQQQSHAWDRSRFRGIRPLRGQVALIVGYGSIGRHIGASLAGLGMVVHGFKRSVTELKRNVTQLEVAGVSRLFGAAELSVALGLADHVVCVLPGDATSERLIDRAAFAAMQPTACLYNLGRGNAIDETALCEALRSGAIAGAFLDVQAEEPLPPTSPLWDVPNLYLTPHASAMRRDYLDLYFAELAVEFGA